MCMVRWEGVEVLWATFWTRDPDRPPRQKTGVLQKNFSGTFFCKKTFLHFFYGSICKKYVRIRMLNSCAFQTKFDSLSSISKKKVLFFGTLNCRKNFFSTFSRLTISRGTGESGHSDVGGSLKDCAERASPPSTPSRSPCSHAFEMNLKIFSSLFFLG